jgi:hypothetical protein
MDCVDARSVLPTEGELEIVYFTLKGQLEEAARRRDAEVRGGYEGKKLSLKAEAYPLQLLFFIRTHPFNKV